MKRVEDYAAMREAARKLVALLDDPQPGLFTWHEFLRDRVNEIHRSYHSGDEE